ncbi:ciliary microtubule-associated protein 3 isoform X3 [Salminus brasiliensis]|uniref:ciliary microtubule-associated protein 3 isoform X3 n=1 Tax=Salminus brasiliensis TaxID=930266 RepID=UPI003B839F41
MATQDAVIRVAFGSCQERKMFPAHRAPNRAGIEFLPQYGSPLLGPGCYDNHVAATPSPQKYQQDWSMSRVCPPGRTPFNSSNQRFRSKPATASSSPGPGAYAHDTPHNQKVSWPMKFGSPDWSRVSQLERKAIRTEVQTRNDLYRGRTVNGIMWHVLLAI